MIALSLKDEVLAQSVSDWVGVEVADYAEESKKALAMVEKRAFFTEKRYFKWEVGLPQGAVPSENCETGEEQQPSKVKIRASRGTGRPEHTYFEGLVTRQKFEAIKDVMLTMMNDFSTFDHYFHFQLCFNECIKGHSMDT